MMVCLGYSESDPVLYTSLFNKACIFLDGKMENSCMRINRATCIVQ